MKQYAMDISFCDHSTGVPPQALATALQRAASPVAALRRAPPAHALQQCWLMAKNQELALNEADEPVDDELLDYQLDDPIDYEPVGQPVELASLVAPVQVDQLASLMAQHVDDELAELRPSQDYQAKRLDNVAAPSPSILQGCAKFVSLDLFKSDGQHCLRDGRHDAQARQHAKTRAARRPQHCKDTQTTSFTRRTARRLPSNDQETDPRGEKGRNDIL